MPSLAAITASVSCASTHPLSVLPAANGLIYAVNGKHRGVFFNGTTAYALGITAPPAVVATAVSSPLYYYVDSIEVSDGGQNYFRPPTVVVAGLTGAKAHLSGSEVSRITFLTSSANFTAPPQVVLTGGQASGAVATATLEATVSGVQIGYGSNYYTAPPAISFFARTGVTEVRAAKGFGVLNIGPGATSGPLSGVVITDGGEYQYTSSLSAKTRPVGATVVAPASGSTPALTVVSSAVVDAVTVGTSGANYASPPAVRFSPLGLHRRGGGAAATASVTSGGVASVALAAFGSGYDGSVSVEFVNEPARAAAIMLPRLAGKYLCGVRYVDAAGQPGNLCPLVTVDCGDGASSIAWNLQAVSYLDGSPNRVTHAELWRTSGDQAITLYRVATVGSGVTSYTDSLTDASLLDSERVGYGELPILTASGNVNAFRFGVPPSHMSAICMFADRAWYAVDESGAEPNALYFSEAGEPESVPATNQLIVQSAGRDADRITGMFPLDGALYVCQQRGITRLTVADSPLEDAAAVPVAQRGLLNDRCWALHEGVAYIADATGFYAFDGASAKPLSDPVRDYWTAPLMEFASAKWFFVAVSPDEQVVRLYYIASGTADTRPNRALCYGLVTQAWWEEQFAHAITASATLYKNGRPEVLGGGAAGIYRLHSGNTDAGSDIQYSAKTGNYPLNNDPRRGVRVVYTPAAGTHILKAAVYYAGATTAQPFAVDTNPGAGFTTTAGSTQAELDLSAAKNASGFAQLSLAGRLDDRSASANRHVAIGIAGSRSGEAKAVLHSMQIEGAG